MKKFKKGDRVRLKCEGHPLHMKKGVVTHALGDTSLYEVTLPSGRSHIVLCTAMFKLKIKNKSTSEMPKYITGVALACILVIFIASFLSTFK